MTGSVLGIKYFIILLQKFLARWILQSPAYQLAHGRRMAHPQSAGQPIVLHRCAALHHGSAHHLARVTLSQQLKFCRTSWQFHFCANDADDALRLLLVMGTHRRTGEIPSVPDSRSGLAHQPEELVLEALLAEIPAANNS